MENNKKHAPELSDVSGIYRERSIKEVSERTVNDLVDSLTLTLSYHRNKIFGVDQATGHSYHTETGGEICSGIGRLSDPIEPIKESTANSFIQQAKPSNRRANYQQAAGSEFNMLTNGIVGVQQMVRARATIAIDILSCNHSETELDVLESAFKYYGERIKMLLCIE